MFTVKSGFANGKYTKQTQNYPIQTIFNLIDGIVPRNLREYFKYQQVNRHQGKADVHKSSCATKSSSQLSSPSAASTLITASSTAVSLGTHSSTSALSLSNVSSGCLTGMYINLQSATNCGGSLTFQISFAYEIAVKHT